MTYEDHFPASHLISNSISNQTKQLEKQQKAELMDVTISNQSYRQNLRQSDTPSATSNGKRPALIRSATTRAATTMPIDSSDEATPLLSKPLMNQSVSAATVLQSANQRPHPSTKPTRPSLLRRATDAVTSTFDLSNNCKDRPPTPSHWSDHTHQKPLLQIWDAVSETSTTAKYGRSITSLIVSTEKRMLERYPELGEGEVGLPRGWIEYVLGLCMRHPFCTSEQMGHWQVLGSSGGARMVWGPF